MKQIIQSHNRRLVWSDTTVDYCKCLKKNKHKCPLPGKFNIENVIHKATVTSDNCEKTYIEATGQSFKKGGTSIALHLKLRTQNVSPANYLR